MLLVYSSTAVFAAVTVVENDADAVALASAAPSIVTEIGSRPKQVGGTNAGALGSVGAALRKIAPANWKGYANGADLNVPVAWKATGVWVDALRDVMAQSGNVATIDWDKKRVLIKKPELAVTKTVAAVAPVTQEPAAPPPRIGANGIIKKGERIDLGLETIANRGGWSFYWYPSISWKAIGDINLKQYPDALAAVSDVIATLRDEGKPVQLRASEGNRVMEVLTTEVRDVH